jgi:hypothetical protein
MTDDADAAGPRDRSPGYPIVSLEMALQRLAEFEAHFKRSGARAEKVGDAWGITAKPYAGRIVAALRYYGLLDYQGSGTDRQVIVSDEGRKYLRAQQEDTKREVIREAALRPKAIAKFWSKWGVDHPADAARLDELVINNGFSEAGARQFLKVYDATISYAKLSDSDKIISQEPSEAAMAPVEHATVGPNANPSSIARQLLDESPTSVQYPKAKSPMLQEIFNLDEGPVTLSFPSELSGESYEDLKDQLELFLRRAQRRAAGKALLGKLSNVGSDADRWHEALTKPKDDSAT